MINKRGKIGNFISTTSLSLSPSLCRLISSIRIRTYEVLRIPTFGAGTGTIHGQPAHRLPAAPHARGKVNHYLSGRQSARNVSLPLSALITCILTARLRPLSTGRCTSSTVSEVPVRVPSRTCKTYLLLPPSALDFTTTSSLFLPLLPPPPPLFPLFLFFSLPSLSHPLALSNSCSRFGLSSS